MLLFCWDSASVNSSSPSLNSKPKLGFDETLGCWTERAPTIQGFWRGEIRWGLSSKNVAVPLFQILPFPAQYSGKLPARFKTCCNDPGVMVQGREHQLMETTQYFRLVSIFFWVCLFPLNCLKSCFPETICQRIPTSLHPSMCLRSPMWPSLGDSRVAPSLFLAACQLFPVIIMWMEARRAGRALPFLESLGTLQHRQQQAPGPS